ncbi:MAG: hypothetical protein OXG72_16660 [Acidobacteria bacterium]|nr:hypothetical protein [Acidobacteriota bacterium]
MADDIRYRYTGDGDYIPGIPARDLTAEDVEQLAPRLLSDVNASPLYEPVKAPRRRSRQEDKD